MVQVEIFGVGLASSSTLTHLGIFGVGLVSLHPSLALLCMTTNGSVRSGIGFTYVFKDVEFEFSNIFQAGIRHSNLCQLPFLRSGNGMLLNMHLKDVVEFEINIFFCNYSCF